MEPLESTSIYMVQSGIARFLNLFPWSDFDPVLMERYNAQSVFEYERIRDFLILHYHATERTDSTFWNDCRTMAISLSLAQTIRLFRDSGRFFRQGEEMFALVSWVQVMIGKGIVPERYHPLVDQVSQADMEGYKADFGRVVASCVQAMPSHAAFIERCCAAAPVPA